jgi:inhibitor of KinA
MRYDLKYSRYNERSVLIEWPALINENILDSILIYKQKIQNSYIKQKVEVMHTYNSILVIYINTIENINDEILVLKHLYLEDIKTKEKTSVTWQIPVCYDKEFAKDLDDLSKTINLSKTEIIRLHSERIYKVFFIGFLPGFLYLGTLNTRLHLARKSTPSLNVGKGSVAIGGNQTGIYPQDSPGGWHVIGKTPIELFSAQSNPPCPIKAGDNLKFMSVDKHAFLDIEKRVSRSTYQLIVMKGDA